MPVEFDGLMDVQDHFEQVLEKSARGVSLPMEMKRSEQSIRDLRTIVRYSNLQSKEELVLELTASSIPPEARPTICRGSTRTLARLSTASSALTDGPRDTSTA